MLVEFRNFDEPEKILHQGDIPVDELPKEGDRVSFGENLEQTGCVVGRGFHYGEESWCHVFVGDYSDTQGSSSAALHFVRFPDVLVNLNAVAAIQSVGPNELHFISSAGFTLAAAEFDSSEERDQALVEITSENALIEPTPAKDVHLEVIEGEDEG